MSPSSISMKAPPARQWSGLRPVVDGRFRLRPMSRRGRRCAAPPNISITDIYRSVIPFVGVMVLMLAIMMLFPELALWLPDRVYNK